MTHRCYAAWFNIKDDYIAIVVPDFNRKNGLTRDAIIAHVQ
jgi:hypothetical protein